MAIKKLQNDFTTPEQSEKLLAMGIPANTADLYYERHSEIKFERLNIRLNKIELADDFFEKHSLYTPHWSVGRLIEIFSKCYTGAKCYYSPRNLYKTEFWIEKFNRLTIIGFMDFSKLED